MSAGWWLGAAVVLTLALGAAAPMAQTGAAPSPGGAAAQPSQGQAFGSYLSMPDHENLMFHDGLDADELIGSVVVNPSGVRIATVTDLLVEPDGGVRLAVIDPGAALGAGSRHVIVPIERLRRTESGTGIVSLDITDAELRALPTYREAGGRWEPIT